MTDALIMQCILAHLRALMQASGTAIQHSNCPNMRNVVAKTSGRTTDLQFQVFKYMNENGMYPIKNVPDAELKESIQTHEQAQKELA